MNASKKRHPGWQTEIERMLVEIEPQDPESAAEEEQRPDWVRKLRRISTETAWAALPMNRAWTEGKRLGCAVGREFVMRHWFLEQFRKGASPQLESFIRNAARDLEEDCGPGVAEMMIKELRTNECDDSERNSALAQILAFAFTAPVKESADFFEGFSMAVRKRADDDEIWASICLRASIYAVLENNWPVIPEKRPLPVLCDYILTRIPATMERGIRRDETLLEAFKENVRKVCNTVGLPTGTRGRPRK